MKLNPKKVIYKLSPTIKTKKVTEEVTEGENGEEKTVKKTKTVKENYEVFFIEPNRLKRDEADMFYTKKVNEYVKDGLLTRHMMSKKIGDNGGAISELEFKNHIERLNKIKDLNIRILELEIKAKDSKLNDADKEELNEKNLLLTDLSRQNYEFYFSQRDAYINTAEAKAENKQIEWIILFCTFLKRDLESDDVQPLYEGETFQEKWDSYAAFEDEDYDQDSEIEKIKAKVHEEIFIELTQIVALWYKNVGNDQESLKKSLKDLNDIDD